MDIKKRLMIQFIIRLLLIGTVLVVLILGVIWFIAVKMIEMELNRDFASAGLPLLMESVHKSDGEFQLEETLLQKVEESGGWLQIVNAKGEVEKSYFVPDDVPNRYNPGELIDFWTGRKPFPYLLYQLIQPVDGEMYSFLYGNTHPGQKLLEETLSSAVLSGSHIELPQSLTSTLEALNGYIQVIDEEGMEVASVNRPEGALTYYSLQEMSLRAAYEGRYGTRSWSEFDEHSGLTWLVQIPSSASGERSVPFYLRSEQNLMLAGFGGLAVVILLLFILFTFEYGRRFGTPLLHMMGWLQNLGQGKYSEPTDRKGNPRSRERTGRPRRKYSFYSDLLQTLSNLTNTLRKNDELRIKLEKSREEWISGVSHDLKTPLSSIKGYAHMLESDSYEWAADEIKDFAATIKEKAAYMDEMIDDLSVTFRLKSGGLPLEKTEKEMNSFIRESIEQFQQDPAFTQAVIRFGAADRDIHYAVDPVWFRRILDNLLANALLHNPPDTEVDVILTGVSPGQFKLNVRDNGGGMNEETIKQLFDRYYRGTNTDHTSRGSGLGMAIAKQLVLAHGGRIDVSSKPGEGSEVCMQFLGQSESNRHS